MDSHEVNLFFAVPLEIWVSKKKKFILNQNNYRNAHWNVLHKAKTAYNQMIAGFNLMDGTEGFPFKNPVRFTYKYYPKTKASYDRMNVLSVHDKFACDALVEIGVLEDDDYRRVLTPFFLHAGVDKENPRMEILVEQIYE